MCELIKEYLPYDTWFCFCTQEEVGLRGAQIAANRINPDIALVVEATTCSDVPGAKEHEYVTRLNHGAAVSIMDRATIVPKDFSQWLYNAGKNNGINVQYKSLVAGGNDAGAIHKSLEGIKTASVSVPYRYLHSPVSIASKKDIEAVKELCKIFLYNIDELTEK